MDKYADYFSRYYELEITKDNTRGKMMMRLIFVEMDNII